MKICQKSLLLLLLLSRYLWGDAGSPFKIGNLDLSSYLCGKSLCCSSPAPPFPFDYYFWKGILVLVVAQINISPPSSFSPSWNCAPGENMKKRTINKIRFVGIGSGANSFGFFLELRHPPLLCNFRIGHHTHLQRFFFVRKSPEYIPQKEKRDHRRDFLFRRKVS